MLRVCSPHCGLDPETTSGGETFERELLARIAPLGVHVDVLLARHKRHPDGVPNWTIHRLPIARGLRWPVAPFVVPRAVKRVWDAAPFDLLRVHSLRYIGPAALLARRRYALDVPIVAHHHHLDANWLNPVIEGRVLRAVERVVVGSEFAVRQAGRELGVPAERFAVVPYGVDARFVPGPRPPALVKRWGLENKTVGLFVGGLKPRKNLFDLLDTWRLVAAERADAVLLICGAGPLRERLERHAGDLLAARRVIFTGYVPEREKVDYYQAADALFFPSSLEGFGFTVAEAMACALPVVCSDRGSLPELLVDGEGGFLVDPGDRDDAARRLLLLLGDAPLRRKLGAANRERAEAHFGWDRCARETKRVYEDLVDDWRKRRAPAR